jgi:hypothetical protein
MLRDLRCLPPDAQAILSVWQAIGMKLDGWLGPWQIFRLLGESVADSLPPALIGFDQLRLFLPTFFSQLYSRSAGSEVDSNALRLVTPYVDVEDQRLFVETIPPEERICNARLLYYKLARAMALMTIAERDQGRRFENVLRLRPDLENMPEWNTPFDDDEFCVDWTRVDEGSGLFVTGDNLIMARREVMLDLVDYLRAAIFDERRGNIHDLLGDFVMTRRLRPRCLAAHIAPDAWPVDHFIKCLEEKAADESSRGMAGIFLDCIRANDRLNADDRNGAEHVLNALDADEIPPVLLLRGRLALAAGRLDDVERLINMLQAFPHPFQFSDCNYYLRRLETARNLYLAEHASAANQM